LPPRQKKCFPIGFVPVVGLILASCQTPTQPLSHSRSSTGWEEDKDRQIAHQLPSQAKKTSVGEIYFNLLPI